MTIDAFRQNGPQVTNNNIDVHTINKDALYVQLSRESKVHGKNMVLLDIKTSVGHTIPVMCHEKDTIKDLKQRLLLGGNCFISHPLNKLI